MGLGLTPEEHPGCLELALPCPVTCVMGYIK